MAEKVLVFSASSAFTKNNVFTLLKLSRQQKYSEENMAICNILIGPLAEETGLITLFIRSSTVNSINHDIDNKLTKFLLMLTLGSSHYKNTFRGPTFGQANGHHLRCKCRWCKFRKQNTTESFLTWLFKVLSRHLGLHQPGANTIPSSPPGTHLSTVSSLLCTYNTKYAQVTYWF